MGVQSNSEKLILIDGSGYIFRAFHAIKPLTRSDGTPVNAVFGFSNMLMKLLEDLLTKSDKELIAVIFDAGRLTFRNDIYPEYKANRDETPEDLIPQFDLIRDATRAFNIACVDMPGFEADDLIATYAKHAKQQGLKVTIVSADKDLMQLVDEDVQMLDPIKQRVIKVPQVLEKFGVPPHKVIDAQALAGDSADNVPGVPGIGIKTAALLLNEYGDLETLLERAEEIKQPKRRESLLKNADLANISKRLVTLKNDVPVTQTLNDFIWQPPDEKALMMWLQEQGFSSIARKAQSGSYLKDNITDENISTGTDQKSEIDYELIQDTESLEKWVKKAISSPVLSVDTETDSLDPLTCKLVGISLSTLPDNGCYIPVGHITRKSQRHLDFKEDHKIEHEAPTQLSLSTVVSYLKPILENPAILKVGQNIKFDMHVLSRQQIKIDPIDDTMVLSYVLDGSSHGHGLDELAKMHLDYDTIKFSEICGSGKSKISFDQVPLDSATRYAAEDANITLRLHEYLKPNLITKKLSTIYERFDKPLINVLTQMESTGVKIDRTALRLMSDDLGIRAEKLKEIIYTQAGRDFNIASPKQLGQILFDELNLGGGKKTSKSGSWSTSAAVLEELAAEGHDLPKEVLNWRQLTKLKSTYTDALQKQIEPSTGRVHTNYSQTITATGRLSSTNPNLQNIPIRSEDGRKIREAFIAESGMQLISADYSQIELRLVAHVANIKALKEAFENGDDIHSATASKMFGLPINNMDPMIRRRAKAINFGIIYGISPFGLAKQLSISRNESKEFIDSYFNEFPEIKQYMEKTKEIAKQQGYVTTLFGRRCQTPGILDRNQNIRGFAERAAINAPIQGGAADIIKRAMIRLPNIIRKEGLAAKMILQVHDELIFEVPDQELEDTKEIIKKVMERAAILSVPLIVDIGAGSNWAEAH